MQVLGFFGLKYWTAEIMLSGMVTVRIRKLRTCEL